jgi:threonine/homoserine/homoserine lactone efflux protein
MTSTLFNGFILGWSVAWPPGPVNAEMIRRGLLHSRQGGGFWSAWRVGLGACSGDFLWALAVTAGAGALLNQPRVRTILGLISFTLLLLLAVIFLLAAWKTTRRTHACTGATTSPGSSGKRRRYNGYFLGFIFAVSSPWNIGFWLAVVGSQQAMTRSRSIADSVMIACAVVAGAVAWTIVLCAAVRSGAHIFARSDWQVWTQLLTAAVMIYFAIKLALQIFA